MTPFRSPPGVALALLCACTAPPIRAAELHPWIVGGSLVPPSTQQALGLVSVGGGCSGTLINRFWVLTADHCVTSNGRAGGPMQPYAALPVTAAWSARTAIPTRYERYFLSNGLDIALIFLGAGDFGNVALQTLHVGPVENDQRVAKYGRGIYAYARMSSGTPPVPIAALQDGNYRVARFPISEASAGSYAAAANGSGQVADGGDSGGPDHLLSASGVPVGIAGVQSSCHYATCLPGKTCSPQPGVVDWRWVSSIDVCHSAAVDGIRDRLLQVAEEGRFPCRDVSAACTVSELTSLLLP